MSDNYDEGFTTKIMNKVNEFAHMPRDSNNANTTSSTVSSGTTSTPANKKSGERLTEKMENTGKDVKDSAYQAKEDAKQGASNTKDNLSRESQLKKEQAENVASGITGKIEETWSYITGQGKYDENRSNNDLATDASQKASETKENVKSKASGIADQAKQTKSNIKQGTDDNDISYTERKENAKDRLEKDESVIVHGVHQIEDAVSSGLTNTWSYITGKTGEVGHESNVKAGQAADTVRETTQGVKDSVKDNAKYADDRAGKAIDDAKEYIQETKDSASNKANDLMEKSVEKKDQLKESAKDTANQADYKAGEAVDSAYEKKDQLKQSSTNPDHKDTIADKLADTWNSLTGKKDDENIKIHQKQEPIEYLKRDVGHVNLKDDKQSKVFK
eukprot:NODE_263_length_12530_cov_0.434881.p4 type:complete len:389 gc:universal NODE_263_length_12530_cov_0.434881:4257-5423(+)